MDKNTQICVAAILAMVATAHGQNVDGKNGPWLANVNTPSWPPKEMVKTAEKKKVPPLPHENKVPVISNTPLPRADIKSTPKKERSFEKRMQEALEIKLKKRCREQKLELIKNALSSKSPAAKEKIQIRLNEQFLRERLEIAKAIMNVLPDNILTPEQVLKTVELASDIFGDNTNKYGPIAEFCYAQAGFPVKVTMIPCVAINRFDKKFLGKTPTSAEEKKIEAEIGAMSDVLSESDSFDKNQRNSILYSVRFLKRRNEEAGKCGKSPAAIDAAKARATLDFLTSISKLGYPVPEDTIKNAQNNVKACEQDVLEEQKKVVYGQQKRVKFRRISFGKEIIK